MTGLVEILGLMTLAGAGYALYLAGLEVAKELSRTKIFNRNDK